MQLRRLRRSAPSRRSRHAPPRGDSAGRRHRPTGSDAAITWPAGDFAGPVGDHSRRSRDAASRHGDVRRSLRVVPDTGGQGLMRMGLMPEGVTPVARTLLIGRGLRAFADGFVSLLLPAYLTALGFSPLEVGVLATATLFGSAGLSLWVGMAAQRFGRQELLTAAAVLMILTGGGFLIETDYWPLLAIAIVGTLNPSSGDVSVFLPLEQALMAENVEDGHRTSVFAAYGLVGSLVAALGAFAAGLPDLMRALFSMSAVEAMRDMFALYMVLGWATFMLYRRLPAPHAAVRPQPQQP